MKEIVEKMKNADHPPVFKANILLGRVEEELLGEEEGGGVDLAQSHHWKTWQVKPRVENLLKVQGRPVAVADVGFGCCLFGEGGFENKDGGGDGGIDKRLVK